MKRSSHRIFLSDTVNVDPRLSGGGVARYFRHIASGIVDHFGGDVVICSSERKHYGPAKYIYSPCFRGNWRIGFHDKVASVVAYLEQPSVFYSPYYGNARTEADQVFTVHDMIHELFPEHFPPENPNIRQFILEKRRCLERASALIAISRSTARDILRCYPHVDANKITTIYYGVDDFFFETVGERDKLPQNVQRPYFLYVGNRALYKNFLRFLMAYGQSGLAKEFDLLVISQRGSGFALGEVECIDRYQLKDCVRLVIAPPQPMLRLSYAQATALIYPSEYEGFGLPILEAFASGTLVATSNVSSMPEVGGDVAFYFDPSSCDSIADCLKRVANLSSADRRDRVAQGIARARTFTWSRCQEQTASVIQGLDPDLRVECST